MTNPNPGPIAQPRLRPNRTPSRPAPGGAGGPPFWDEPLNRRQRRAFYGRPRRIAADGPIAMGALERQRIEHNIATMIDLLDASENTDADCCEAGDDDPSSSCPAAFGCAAEGRSGEPDDAEDGDPQGNEDADREPSIGSAEGHVQGYDTPSGLEDRELDNSDAEPWLGWTLSGNIGCAADDDRERDNVDSEAETDMCQADDPVFPHRDLLRQQLARAGCEPGDTLRPRHLGAAA